MDKDVRAFFWRIVENRARRFAEEFYVFCWAVVRVDVFEEVLPAVYDGRGEVADRVQPERPEEVAVGGAENPLAADFIDAETPRWLEVSARVFERAVLVAVRDFPELFVPRNLFVVGFHKVFVRLYFVRPVGVFVLSPLVDEREEFFLRHVENRAVRVEERERRGRVVHARESLVEKDVVFVVVFDEEVRVCFVGDYFVDFDVVENDFRTAGHVEPEIVAFAVGRNFEALLCGELDVFDFHPSRFARVFYRRSVRVAKPHRKRRVFAGFPDLVSQLVEVDRAVFHGEFNRQVVGFFGGGDHYGILAVDCVRTADYFHVRRRRDARGDHGGFVAAFKVGVGDFR